MLHATRTIIQQDTYAAENLIQLGTLSVLPYSQPRISTFLLSCNLHPAQTGHVHRREPDPAGHDVCVSHSVTQTRLNFIQICTTPLFLQDTYAAENLIQLGTLSVLPYMAELILERGLVKAVLNVVHQIAAGALAFFITR